ncbi:uncharacterized protein K02A2.6-like [Cydia fagiglandana]|uniref:uncharacterized protein K02A2.6-like n=1 Tax=Cydia fagiglandana TaxID=1458189 RepID=UPI002FEE02B0
MNACNSRGVTCALPTLTPPYHPASNGAAENAVRSVKRALKKANVENEDAETALSRFLFSYRNTEHSTTGREPAVALLGRRLRGRLDLLRPDASEVVRKHQLASEQRRASRLRQATVGDPVIIRDYTKQNRKWTEGIVIDCQSPVSYSVKTGDGQVHKRHIDQMLQDKRKSRFSLTKVQEPVVADNGQREVIAKESIVDEWQLAEEEPESHLPAVKSPVQNADCKMGPSSPQEVEGRTRRQAALRCIEKLQKSK